jgi:hypothetical protein
VDITKLTHTLSTRTRNLTFRAFCLKRKRNVSFLLLSGHIWLSAAGPKKEKLFKSSSTVLPNRVLWLLSALCRRHPELRLRIDTETTTDYDQRWDTQTEKTATRCWGILSQDGIFLVHNLGDLFGKSFLSHIFPPYISSLQLQKIIHQQTIDSPRAYICLLLLAVSYPQVAFGTSGRPRTTAISTDCRSIAMICIHTQIRQVGT